MKKKEKRNKIIAIVVVTILVLAMIFPFIGSLLFNSQV